MMGKYGRIAGVFRYYDNIVSFFRPSKSFDSKRYWEKRYRFGGNSGPGSYSQMAEFKADVLNRFVSKYNIDTVIELGCGDGNQLSLCCYPSYVGVDISKTAITLCRKKFKNDATKNFFELRKYTGETADLAMSLDVIFHLVEDDVYEKHMRMLFEAGKKYVVIYSSNKQEDDYKNGSHVKHRKFTDWIKEYQPQWVMIEKVDNAYPFKGSVIDGSFSDFYFFEKRPDLNGSITQTTNRLKSM